MDGPARPTGRCRADNTIVCGDRYDAVKAGEFVFDHLRGAWIDPYAPLRRMKGAARFLLLYYDGKPMDGEPFTFTNCPYCGGDLPDASTIWKAIIDGHAEG